MRKFKLLSLLLLASTFIFINCTKEGPEGPAGATGPQGPAGSTGATGATGSANVIYSSWLTQTGWHDSTMTDFGLTKIDYRTATGITAAIISNGVVLAYLAPSATSTFAYTMPWIYSGLNPNIIVSIIPTVGRLIYYNKEINSAAGGIVPSASYVYRYILIPGGVLGGRGANSEKVAEINGQLYTESQLRAMPYNEVCSLLSIPQ
jgi:hypothetical protein